MVSMSEHKLNQVSTQFDGLLVQYRAVARGFQFERFPGQLLILSDSKLPARKSSFVHSVGGSTRISSVTFLLQKRFRRALLEMADIPMPPGATFTFRSRSSPARYAERVGFPVVVKEVFGENPSVQVRDVDNDAKLMMAAAQIRAILPTDKWRQSSSYAQSINLSSAEDVGDSLLKSSDSRYLIEKQVNGSCYRAFVVGGRVRLMTQSAGISWQVISSKGDVAVLSEAAVAAVPGVESGTVDVVVDHTGEPFVVELAERLVIPDSWQEQEDAYVRLVDQLIDFECQWIGVADRVGSVGGCLLHLGGLDRGPQVLQAALFNVVGLDVTVAEHDEIAGTASIWLAGSALDIASAIEILAEQKIASVIRASPGDEIRQWL